MSNRPIHTLALPAATLAALTRAGYETVKDITGSTPEQLASDAKISVFASQAVLSATQATKAPSLTQSAAALVQQNAVKYQTGCRPVDDILDGGLKRGFVLELSGPPGSCKEALAIDMARAFVEDGQGVLLVDMQNMITATQLSNALAASSEPSLKDQNYAELVFHISLHTLPELVIFLHKLSWYLDKYPKIGLLILNSFWFPFQSSTGMSTSARTALLERTRQTLAHACASTSLSVVVTTQLSTKLLKEDGSPASFDTGARAVMVPQPASTYLPAGRSYRIMIVPKTRTAGVVRLISSPTHVYVANQPALREMPYEMTDGIMKPYDEDRPPH